MLTAIEEMKYFLRTTYGDSKGYVGSTIEVKFQDLCQGNGASPAGWSVISIKIINVNKRKVMGATSFVQYQEGKDTWPLSYMLMIQT